MNQLTITCPHCSFSKNVDRQQIPVAVKNIKCPRCQKAFAFDPSEVEVSFQEVPATAIQPGGESNEPAHSQAQKTNGGSEFVPSTDPKFCSTCGRKIHRKAEICPNCGVRVAAPANALNKVALLLITFFLGGLGAHKFYQKKYWLGALYLVFFWTYIPALVAFVEFIIYACKSETELQQRYPETSGGVIVFAVIIPLVGIAMIGIVAAIAIPQFVAYREKAYNAAASNDLKACKTRAESYYAENRVFPTDVREIRCGATENVALYYLSFGPDEYQLISFHDRGKKAFLNSSSDNEIAENTREAIEKEIAEKFGSSALKRSFHFIK
jgi:predicted Zn finger-like uncharacterized protein